MVEINQLFPFAKKKRTSITKLLLNKGMTKETAHPSETKSKRNLFTVSIYQKRLSKGVKRIILLTSFRFCFSTFLNKTSFFFWSPETKHFPKNARQTGEICVKTFLNENPFSFGAVYYDLYDFCPPKNKDFFKAFSKKR